MDGIWGEGLFIPGSTLFLPIALFCTAFGACVSAAASSPFFFFLKFFSPHPASHFLLTSHKKTLSRRFFCVVDIYIGSRFRNVLNYYCAAQIVQPSRQHSHLWSPQDWMLHRTGMRTRDETDGRGGQGTKIGTPCHRSRLSAGTERGTSSLYKHAAQRSECRKQRGLHHFSLRVI